MAVRNPNQQLSKPAQSQQNAQGAEIDYDRNDDEDGTTNFTDYGFYGDYNLAGYNYNVQYPLRVPKYFLTLVTFFI